MGNGYRDVKAATDDTHKIIWGAWFFTGVLMLILGIATDGIPILGVVVGFIFEWGWIPATIIAIILSIMAENKKDDARKRAME
ncbi:hypothetical protein ACH427_03130 [Streptomyces sp. NPDC020379]|uniref:hypothetical protein n=1 Tax=Streptomyces sp. NPDC020379 TaxID=3365071 RepID=UPI00379DAEBE